jgi:hypothetical protein
MTLWEYDRWMTELSNQQQLKGLGYGNVSFRDQSQDLGLMAEPAPGGKGTPVYNTWASIVIHPLQDLSKYRNTMVDPVTGQWLSGDAALKGTTF